MVCARQIADKVAPPGGLIQQPARRQLVADMQEENTMARLTTTTAPDFVLQDTLGRSVRLADFRGEKHVVLVFNRGFA
jgi:hypothetical protein